MFSRRPVALLRTVVVNLKSGTALRGALARDRGGWLILKAPELLEPDQPPTRIDGEVLVDRSNVDFVQALPTKEP